MRSLMLFAGMMLTMLCLTSACVQRSFHARAMELSEEREGFEIVLDPGVAAAVDSLGLLSSLRRAKESYERFMGIVDSRVKVILLNEKCDSAGYDFVSGDIRFCNQDNVVALGTRSQDVLFREAFLGMFCATHKILCSPISLQVPGTRELVIGVSEYFAFLQKQDANFGEGYFEGRPWIRRYADRGPDCELAEASEQPLVKILIDEKYSLEQLRDEIESSLFLATKWMTEKHACFAKKIP